MSEREDVHLTSVQLRDRFGGISNMTLWRWLNDPRLDFPKPLVINRHRYWRLGDILAWERSRAAKAA